MFLGANMDAVKEAASIGITKDYATNYTYTAQGTSAVFDTMSCVTSSLRGCVDTCDAKGIKLDDTFDLATAYAAVSNVDGNKTEATEKISTITTLNG
jgi:hypothetical protein